MDELLSLGLTCPGFAGQSVETIQLSFKTASFGTPNRFLDISMWVLVSRNICFQAIFILLLTQSGGMYFYTCLYICKHIKIVI